jgi:hypothetical protein
VWLGDVTLLRVNRRLDSCPRCSFCTVCRRLGELMPVALVVGKLSLSLKPRFHHDMVGVIAIQRISNLTVTGNALQCH